MVHPPLVGPLVGPESLRDVLARTTERLPLLIGSLPERPGNLRVLGERARLLLGCTMPLTPDDPVNARWLRSLARAYTLQAARRLEGDGPVALDPPLLGRVAVPRSDEAGLLFVHQYNDACHAALAPGDEEALALLGAVPPSALEGMKGADLPHLSLSARSLRHHARGEGRPSAVLALEAVQACDSPALTGRPR